MSANLPRAASDGPSLVRGRSWDAVVDEVRRLGGAQLPPGVSRPGDFGPVPSGTETYARITGGGTGGKYSWAEVTRQGGSWVDTGRAGSASLDPAIEANARTNVAAGRRVRMFRSRGEWVFAVPVCAPPNLCCPDVPSTLYMTMTSGGVYDDIGYFRDCVLTYDAANNRWWGCVDFDSMNGGPVGGWTGVNGAGVCTGDPIISSFKMVYFFTCSPATGGWAIRYLYRTCQSPTGGRSVLLGLTCEETAATGNSGNLLSGLPVSCDPFHFRVYGPENYWVDITA